MKIQSKKLMKYLADAGVLNGSREEISQAKVLYRRMYKREWKSKNKKPKELRPGFTSAEYEEIGMRAKLYGLNATTFARDCILSSILNMELVPNREQLVHVLQAISMSEISLSKNGNPKEVQALLLQAEEMLLKYLNMQGR